VGLCAPDVDPRASATGPNTGAIRVYSDRIRIENGVGDRCLRKWIARGLFPIPDGNLAGRNWWHASTYERWLDDVAAGKFRQDRRPRSLRIRAAVDETT
jgi:hypothetical protein